MTDNINAAIKFIAAYREMEKRSYADGFATIYKCVKAPYRAHLCRSWQGKKRDFGSFFLNLSHVSQGAFIEHWGIEIDGYLQYCQSVEGHPEVAIFLNPPPMIGWLHELLRFFYNHAVMDECAPGIKLPNKPRKVLEYGNSTNWGKYILELRRPDAARLLENLESYILETKHQFNLKTTQNST